MTEEDRHQGDGGDSVDRSCWDDSISEREKMCLTDEGDTQKISDPCTFCFRSLCRKESGMGGNECESKKMLGQLREKSCANKTSE